jgi:hypothetical protein
MEDPADTVSKDRHVEVDEQTDRRRADLLGIGLDRRERLRKVRTATIDGIEELRRVEKTFRPLSKELSKPFRKSVPIVAVPVEGQFQSALVERF